LLISITIYEHILLFWRQVPEWLLQPIPTKANLGHIPGEIGLEVSYKTKRFKGSSTGPSVKQVDVCAVISGLNGFYTNHRLKASEDFPG
jgi:hypothetical protein